MEKNYRWNICALMKNGPKISLLVAQRKDDNREKMGFLYYLKKNWARLIPQGFFSNQRF